MTLELSWIHLDLRDATPLAEQIANQLRAAIHQGRIEPGARLPSVRQFAQQLQINFNTVARAYRILDAEGLILSRQGQGTVVVESPAMNQAKEKEDVLSVQEQMDRLVNAMEQLARAVGLEMADVIAHIQGSRIEALARAPRRRKIKTNRRARHSNPFAAAAVLARPSRKRVKRRQTWLLRKSALTST